MRYLPRTALIAITLLLGGLMSTAAHPPTIVSESAEKGIGDEIRAFRKTMADALAAKNAKALQDMYAKSFVHQSSSGNFTRESRIADATAGYALIEGAAAPDMTIRAPNDWVAIATGTSATRTKTSSITQRVKWIAVYTRAGNSWILAASQESIVETNKP